LASLSLSRLNQNQGIDKQSIAIVPRSVIRFEEPAAFYFPREDPSKFSSKTGSPQPQIRTRGLAKIDTFGFESSSSNMVHISITQLIFLVKRTSIHSACVFRPDNPQTHRWSQLCPHRPRHSVPWSPVHCVNYQRSSSP